jgi:hypothetical protein
MEENEMARPWVYPVAVHEAGHAIVDLSVGLKLQKIEVKQHKSGFTHLSKFNIPWGDMPWDFDLAFARRWLTVDVAGCQAERILLPHPPLSRPILEMLLAYHGVKRERTASIPLAKLLFGDYWNALWRAFLISRHVKRKPKPEFFIGNEDRNAEPEVTRDVLMEIKRAEGRAEKILKHDLAALAKLAHTLKKKRSLTGEQVAQLLAEQDENAQKGNASASGPIAN